MDNISFNDKQGSGKTFRPVQVIVPLILGIGVAVWMFVGEFDNFEWSSIRFTQNAVIGLILVILSFIGRDFGLTWRFRAITNKDLSWRQSLKVCMLCEFSSAITPTAVGGSSLAMIFMNREGINLGRATTLMLITIFLDELFFVIFAPLVFIFIPFGEIFGSINMGFTLGIKWAFWIIYAVITLWTLVLFAGIIIKPVVMKKILVSVFKVRFLKRWAQKAEELGDHMIEASVQVRNMSIKWWINAFSATILSWCSRFFIVNALFITFIYGGDQILIFAKQVVVWLMLMVTPTPGGSGISEWLFTEYYADMVPVAASALLLALMWRLVSYYVYLFIGALIVPSWLRKFKK